MPEWPPGFPTTTRIKKTTTRKPARSFEEKKAQAESLQASIADQALDSRSGGPIVFEPGSPSTSGANELSGFTDGLAAWSSAAAGLGGLAVAGFGIPQLISLGRQQRAASLLRVIEELRDENYQQCAKVVNESFPIPSGETVAAQVEAFLSAAQSFPPEVFEAAEQLINRLNNIAQMIDSRVVSEPDLHGQTHPTVILLSARLDPFILARSACEGYRWGMRIRRLGVGAKRYWRLSPLHRENAFVRDNVELVPATPRPWRDLFWIALRAWFFHRYMPTPESRMKLDADDLAEASAVLATCRLNVDFLGNTGTL